MGQKINDYLHDVWGKDGEKGMQKGKNDPRAGRGSNVNWRKYYEKRDKIFGNK